MPSALTVLDGLNLARRRLASGQFKDVVQLCRQVLRVDAESLHALHMLAIVANKTGKPERAQEIIERALIAHPNDPGLRNTLGLILTKLGHLDAAEQQFRDSLARDPGRKEPWLNLAAVLEQRNDFKDALDILSSLEERFGSDAENLSLRAVVLESQGQFAAALGVLEAAERIAPDNIDIRFAKANLLLLLGRLDEGWPDFELRRSRLLGRPPPLNRPIWPGTLDPETRLLVYSEHGLGDAIQFARYVPFLVSRGLDVTFACYRSLIPLMRTLTHSGRLIPDDGEMPDCDYVAPLMSLPRLLGHGVHEISELSTGVPYLFPDPTAKRRLKVELDKLPGMKVGLAWQGNPNQATDRDRSIPIACFEPIMALKNLTIVSLQKGVGERDIDIFKDRYRIIDWPRSKAGLEPTAHLIGAVDLVITTDTAIAHLAGALGARTWLLLSAKPSWRWLLDRSDSPWYPAVRLFRQSTFRDWHSVIGAVQSALLELMQHQQEQDTSKLAKKHTKRPRRRMDQGRRNALTGARHGTK